MSTAGQRRPNTQYLKVSLGLVSHCLMHQCFTVKNWLSQLTGVLMISHDRR
eukprot:COSAG03_NODE_115_length_12417_cov_9.898945_1_plen_50_part_10